MNAWIRTAAARALKQLEADRSQKGAREIQSAKKISHEEAVKVSLRKY